MLDTTYVLRVHWLRKTNHRGERDRTLENLPFGYRRIEAFPCPYVMEIKCHSICQLSLIFWFINQNLTHFSFD